MNLFILTASDGSPIADKTAAAVTSVTDSTPVEDLGNLVLGDSEPLVIKFTTGTAAPSFAGDTTYSLSASLGAVSPTGADNLSSTSTFSAVTGGWSGRLSTNTPDLVDAINTLGGGMVVRAGAEDTAGPRGGWLALQIRVTDPNGYTTTYALLRVFVEWRVIAPELPASSPENPYTEIGTATGTSLALSATITAPTGTFSPTTVPVSFTSGSGITAGRGSVRLQGNNNTERFEIISNAGAFFQGYGIGGTIASPAATPVDATIVGITARGHDGASYVSGSKGSFEFYSLETWTPTANGVGFRIRVTPAGSTALGTVATFLTTGTEIYGVDRILTLTSGGSTANSLLRFSASTGGKFSIGYNKPGATDCLIFYDDIGSAYLGQWATGGTLTVFGGMVSNSATAGIGYASGAGGTVTQATSRTTGVTLNKITGAITLVSAAGSASYQTFTVTNSTVAATDVVVVSQKSGADKNIVLVTAIAAGSFNISFATTGGTTTEQPVFNFAVIKAVTS